MTIRNFITFVSKNQIKWYIEANKTEEEEQEYYASGEYASGEYELHLSYLIETWVSNTKNELGYNDEILDDPNLNPIFNTSLVTSFDKEWLVDIFESDILSTVCLK